MDHKSPIKSVKKSILDYLSSNEKFNYLEIKESYLNQNIDLPLKKPLLTISRGRILSKSIGFQDYIGNRVIDDKFIELRGKDLVLIFEIDIWNNISPKFGGESEVEKIKEILFEMFEFNPKFIDGVNVIEFKDGDTFEDPFKEGLFHSRCTLKLRTLWIKEFEYDLLEEINTNSIIIE